MFDVSGSMGATDVKPTRLAAARRARPALRATSCRRSTASRVRHLRRTPRRSWYRRRTTGKADRERPAGGRRAPLAGRRSATPSTTHSPRRCRRSARGFPARGTRPARSSSSRTARRPTSAWIRATQRSRRSRRASRSTPIAFGTPNGFVEQLVKGNGRRPRQTIAVPVDVVHPEPDRTADERPASSGPAGTSTCPRSTRTSGGTARGTRRHDVSRAAAAGAALHPRRHRSRASGSGGLREGSSSRCAATVSRRPSRDRPRARVGQPFYLVPPSPRQECHNVKDCVSVIGPWVVVPASGEATVPARLPEAAGDVGGTDSRASSTSVHVWFDGQIGAPIAQSVTTGYKLLFHAVSKTGKAGRLPAGARVRHAAEARNGRSTVSARGDGSGDGDRDRSTTRCRPSSSTPARRRRRPLTCPGREGSSAAGARSAFVTIDPPSARTCGACRDDDAGDGGNAVRGTIRERTSRRRSRRSPRCRSARSARR